MAKKRIVMAIGHKDMGTNLPEQKEAVKRTAKVIADFIQDGWQVAIVHSNAPQVARRIQLRSYVCMLRYEPGLYRL